MASLAWCWVLRKNWMIKKSRGGVGGGSFRKGCTLLFHRPKGATALYGSPQPEPKPDTATVNYPNGYQRSSPSLQTRGQQTQQHLTACLGIDGRFGVA